MIGNNIKNLRKKKGWSQELLATKCGLHRNSIYNIEKSATMPGMPQIKAIANAFEISVDELFDADTVLVAELVAENLFPNDEQKAIEYKESHLLEELEDEQLIFIANYYKQIDEVFIRETRIVHDSLLQREMIGAFNSLNRRGKFEALDRIHEMLHNQRYFNEPNNN